MAASIYFKFSVSQFFLSSLLVFHASGFPLRRLKSFEIIRGINSKGPYLGLIPVYSLEEKALFSTGFFQPASQYTFCLAISSREVARKGSHLCQVWSWDATQQMLDLFNIDGPIHFGISWNLNSSMNIGDVVPNQFTNTGFLDWLGLELEKCVNSSLCLKNRPKVVLWDELMKASTANMFLDNGSYRDFLFQILGVSSAYAVVMTSLSNGFLGLSDLAGTPRSF